MSETAETKRNVLKIEHFDIDDSDIPDAVKNYEPLQKPKKPRAKSGTTNLLITFNPNISITQMKDPATRALVAKRLIIAGKNLEGRLRDKALLKHMGNTPQPNLTEWKGRIEIGTKKGFLHLHAIAKFDGYCQMNLPAAKKMLEYIVGGGQPLSGHFNVQAFVDVAKAVDAYVEKAQNDDETKVINI